MLMRLLIRSLPTYLRTKFRCNRVSVNARMSASVPSRVRVSLTLIAEKIAR